MSALSGLRSALTGFYRQYTNGRGNGPAAPSLNFSRSANSMCLGLVGV